MEGAEEEESIEGSDVDGVIRSTARPVRSSGLEKVCG